MRYVLAVLLVLASGPLLATERASLDQLSGYLNTIDAATARFTQINADGTRSQGTMYIDRPGKARFEYDPPDDDALMVASGGQVAIFDGRASGRPEQYPLRRTPLNVILARNVDLSRASMITGIGTHRDMTIVEASDREHPEYGKIRLYFETAPLRLAEWLILAESGEETRVILEPFAAQDRLSPFLFDISYISDERR